MDYTLKSTSPRDEWVEYTLSPRILDTFMEAGRTRTLQKPKTPAIELLKRNLETIRTVPFLHEFSEAIPGDDYANRLTLHDAVRKINILLYRISTKKAKEDALVIEAAGASKIKDDIIRAIESTVKGIDIKVEEHKEKTAAVASVLRQQGVPATPATGPIQKILGYAGITSKKGMGKKHKKTRRSTRRVFHRPQPLQKAIR